MQLTFWRNDETSTFGRSSVDSLDNIDELNPCELPGKYISWSDGLPTSCLSVIAQLL